MHSVLKRLRDRLIIDQVEAVARSIVWGGYHPWLHPYAALRRHALEETVDYIKRNMSTATIEANAFEVLRRSLEAVTIDGLFLEFGVRSGTTINFISAIRTQNIIYGFDSFEGLPEPWRGFKYGRGALRSEGLPKVNENVRVVKGLFEDTLPGFVLANPGPVSFVHIDSDLYSSAKTVLMHLGPRVARGTVMVFNEYFNFPTWQEHEYKAFQEFCSEFTVKYRYLCWGYYEVGVVIDDIVR